MKKIIIIATIVIIGLTAAAIFSLKKENTKATTEVIVKKAEFSKFVESIKAEGTVEIKNDKEIFLAKNQRVETVPVEVGDEVKKGQVLITFDPDERETIIRNIKKKEISIEQEKIKLKGYQFDVSKVDVESSEREYKKAKEKQEILTSLVKVAESEKKTLELNLDTREKELIVKKKVYDVGGISFTDLKDFETTVNSLKNDIAKKNSEIEEAKLNEKQNIRDIELKKSQYENAETRYNESDTLKVNNILTSKNNIKTMELELEDLKNDLSKTYREIKSPVNGTITEVKAEPNFRVNVEQSLMTIADMGSQIIKAKVLSSDIGKVKLGEKVLITSDSMEKGKKIDGKVSKIASIATTDEGSGYSDVIVEVEIEFNPKDSGIKPGYRVNCEIITGEKENTMSVNSMAILREKGKRYVMIALKNGKNKNEKAVKKKVETGLENGTIVEVKGIEKDVDIIQNPRGLKDGDSIKIVDKIVTEVSKKREKDDMGSQPPGEGGKRK